MLHSMLKRQLEQLNITDTSNPPDAVAWLLLLERISKSYTEAEQDRYLIERSLEISSQEMKAEIEERKKVENNLRKAQLDLQKQNRQLERVHEFLRETLERVTEVVRRNGTQSELLSYLQQAQAQFDDLS
ncbi:MAG: hypothetical protein L0154_25510 [Chloroflexi bacterium]|nr:hypothetical protein [Chloroflexota bacterium]